MSHTDIRNIRSVYEAGKGCSDSLTVIMMSLRSRIQVLNEIAQEEKAEYRSPEELSKIAAFNEAKREKRRRKIIKEIFETEKTYQNLLDIIHRFFYFPLRFDCIIPEAVHNKLFSNIEQIQHVNIKLLDQMEQNTIGQAFLSLGPFLKLYSTYANNHTQALATFQEWLQKSSEFAEFIQNQEARPEVMGLKFNALLITPVQRVPRYKLLLEDLLEHTPTSHYDYHDLQEAAKEICNIAFHINEHIRQHENFQKMLSIQKSLGTTPKILSPGREFIREGALRKVARKGGKSHDRMFFLFSDMLIYAKPKLLDTCNSFNCCCVLPLRHCTIQRLFEDNKELHSGGMFQITCKEESLVLYSLDPAEVTNWIECLESAIKKLTENRQTLKKPSSNKVPLRGRTLLRQKKLDKKNSRKVRPTIQKSLLFTQDENSPTSDVMESEVKESTPTPRSRSHSPFREPDAILDSSFKRKWEKEASEIEKQLSSELWSSSLTCPAGATSSHHDEMDSFMLVDEGLTENIGIDLLTPENNENINNNNINNIDDTPQLPPQNNIREGRPRPLSQFFNASHEDPPPTRYKSLNSVFSSTRRRFQDRDQRCSLQ
ncbi:rho guanine nucleotide exchange factor 39-like isoform X1 [Octopus sinensis]|uniref:Rho guanine nucleotide exchange factor 39-like isoform X1 n=2 Tax=Octopus sinensis TaxID=2607531 RepID=A0A7E6F8A5_9MOLL|nr:rho guanine nucleotide exchange factor 39-like isoform X1 [Octopus sinensis]